MNWQVAVNKAIELRHWFHRNPELTWEEQNTAAKIRECLSEWGIEWRACADFGTVATLGKQAKGKNIALRADMDALPIMETAEVDYQSQTPGKMHACGHDGHMAALLGTAYYLKQQEAELKNSVTLVFQPAEEGGHGAKKMIEDGALDGVDEIYGWHNWPAIKFGKAICPDGPIMSGNASFFVEVTGEGGHASQPEACRDPLLAAAAMVMNIQQIVSRRLPPQAAVVMSVTQINAGTTTNIIPETVKFAGTIRYAEPHYQQIVTEHLNQVLEDTARSYAVSVSTKVKPFYNATVNHAQPAARFREVLQTELGEQYSQVGIQVPIMGAEDFSYYLQEVPGAFALIGMAESDGQAANFNYPCHSPNYIFNDKLLELVMRSFVKIVT